MNLSETLSRFNGVRKMVPIIWPFVLHMMTTTQAYLSVFPIMADEF